MKFKDAQMVPIDKLIPYELNAKEHTDEQINSLASIFLELGFDQPITVDKNFVIIKGHGRRLAAMKLGWTEVPVIIRDDLTAAKVRASRIADNEIARKTGYDREKLTVDLQMLQEEADDLLSLTSFDENELDAILKTGAEVEFPDLPDGDRAPFQQIAFKLHDSQAEIIRSAIDRAHRAGPYDDGVNENRSANAITRICQHYLEAKK